MPTVAAFSPFDSLTHSPSSEPIPNFVQANVYQGGESERLLGEYISNCRSEVLVVCRVWRVACAPCAPCVVCRV